MKRAQLKVNWAFETEIISFPLIHHVIYLTSTLSKYLLTLSIANFLGYAAGNIAGPLAFASTPGPRYSGGFISCVAFLIALISVTLFGRWYLGRENARRDREYGPPSEEIGLEDTTDKENKNFRYMI